MWITFLFKMLTYYPYVVLFGFLRADVEEHAGKHAAKAYDVIEKPLRWACWMVFVFHMIIVGVLASIVSGIVFAVS